MEMPVRAQYRMNIEAIDAAAAMTAAGVGSSSS